MTPRRHPQVLLLLLAAVLLSATLVAPSVPLKRASYRYVLVFDISQSMNTADVGSEAAPLARLEFAKQRALEALKGLPCGSEVGIALFTGHRAFLMLTPIELCANFQELSTMLASIDWRMTWEERSEVAKGVFRSLELLRALTATTRLVFLTDGHEAPPLNPDVKPGFSGEVGAVRGLLIGVGGALPVPIPKFDAEGKQQGNWQAEDVMQVDTFRAEQQQREGVAAAPGGTEHLSSLKEDYLRALAQETGLDYLRLEDSDALLHAMTGKALAIPKTQPTDIRWLIALAALLALSTSLLRRFHTKAPSSL